MNWYDFSTGLFLGGDDNTAVLINGDVDGPIVSGGDSVVIMAITPNGYVYGDPDERIGLFGTNSHLVLNGGYIGLDVAFGSGDDLMVNFGYVDGDVSMGAGNDIFINDEILFDDYFLYGNVYGDLMMGSGDDIVLNSNTLGRVFLGDGNDFYSAITPLSAEDNYDHPFSSSGVIKGGRGNDTVYGGANDDIIFGGANSDVLRGNNGDDVLNGGNGKDLLQGGNGDDNLTGGKGKDVLKGGKGEDTMFGGSGQDKLTGGRGDDRMSGGSGADQFIFSGDSGLDVIVDFTSDDQVRLVGDRNAPFPVLTDAEVLASMQYEDGYAFLDLSALYKTYSPSRLPTEKDGVGIIFLGVEEGDLTGDNFYTYGDTLVIG